MFNAFKYFEEFRETFGEEAALKLIRLASEIYESLSQSVTKTEFNELKKIVQELAEAQKRTEKEIAKLARGLQRVRKEVGGLSRTVAYALENEAYRHLPVFLKETFAKHLFLRSV